MLSKKSMGLHWDVLLVSFFIAVGILLYSTSNPNIPKVGEVSINMIKFMEKNSNIPAIVDYIMKWINKKATAEFDSHKVLALNSYCEDPDYRASLISKSFEPPAWLSRREHAKCLVDEEELGNYYWEFFDEKYTNFKTRKIDYFNLDFSNVNYDYAVKKENDIFFIEARTNDKLKIPIKTEEGKKEEKQIGAFYVNPSFKLPVGYDFTDPKKEVCIFSSDCVATCHDVIDRYPDEGYTIKESGCELYYDCYAPKDDFDKEFLCDEGVLCKGQCLQFCSASSGRVDDADASTKCTKYSCSNYWSCSDANVCGCPDPSNPSFNNACGGLDCDTLNCDSDSEFENEKKITTQCLDSCGKYGDCSSANLCVCNSGLSSCQGSCYCNPQEWKSTGGCGNKREDGIQCEWNGIPQKREYNPSTCSSPDYRCELQPVEV